LSLSDHFSHEDWVDFVRGVAAPDERRDIEGHLRTGCRDCAVQREIWHGVAEIASADQQFDPPASAVRRALAFYSVQKPVGRMARAFDAVKMLFDSALVPMRLIPNAELHVFPNCGHWAMIERKAEFENVVLAFLTRS